MSDPLADVIRDWWPMDGRTWTIEELTQHLREKWLPAHDAEVRRQTLLDAADTIRQNGMPLYGEHRAEFAAWLEDRADERATDAGTRADR